MAARDDSNDPNTDLTLGDDLLEVGVEPLPDRRARLRRVATVGAVLGGLAVAVVAVTLLLTTGSDEEPGIDSASDVATAEPEPAEAPADTGASDAASEESSAAPDEARAVESTSTVSAVDGFAADGGGSNWVVPWGDGFVAVSVLYSSPDLPEFPDEVRALFPQEVLDVLEAADVSTVAEAQEVLEEAGLFSQVLDILNANPDVMEAVTTPGEVEITISQSPDGLDWTTVDTASLPMDPTDIMGVASDGSHLVITAGVSEANRPERRRTVVLTTDDLASWDSFEIPSDVDADLPDYVMTDTYVSSVAVGPNGWVALAQTNNWIDESALFPDDIVNARAGWGTSHGPDGLTVEVYSEPDYVYDEAGNVDDAATDWDCCEQPAATYFYSWDELGIDAETYERYTGEPGRSVVWSAPWGGIPQSTTLPGEGFGGTISATSVGFLTQTYSESGPSLLFSPDGITWSPAEKIESDWINTIAGLDGGVLLFGGSDDETSVWLGDGDGTNWRQVEIPRLPAGAASNIYTQSSSGAGFASLIDASVYEDPYAGIEVDEVTYEHEGFAITERNDYTDNSNTQSVKIVELATSTVVLDESYSWDYTDDEEPSGPPYIEYDEFGEGARYLDPATGDEIVFVPWDVSNQAWEAAWNAALEDAGIDPYAENEYDYAPDLWLVATTNGIDWLVEDLPDPDAETGYWPQVAAINGDVVIVSGPDGLTRYSLG